MERMAFKFPEGIDSFLRESLRVKCQSTESLVETVAHQIQEEGQVLQKAAEHFYPGDPNITLAIQGYVMVGDIFLQTVRELKTGVNNERTSLLKDDPRGISLLAMLLGEIDIEHCADDPEEKIRVDGRFAGIGRYQELLIDLMARGVHIDTF